MAPLAAAPMASLYEVLADPGDGGGERLIHLDRLPPGHAGTTDLARPTATTQDWGLQQDLAQATTDMAIAAHAVPVVFGGRVHHDRQRLLLTRPPAR